MNFPETKISLKTQGPSQESKETKTNDIILRGHLIPNGSIRRHGNKPIVAQLNGTTVFVTFLIDVDVLNVTITGVQGVIYSSKVDTSFPSTLTIPLADFPEGNYTIEFTNQYGAMEGDFLL